MKRITLGGLALAFWVLAAPPARAQDTFDDLGRRIHEGQQVIVIDQLGTKTQGRVATLSSGTLVISAPLPRTFAPSEVREVRKPDRLWDGAVKGAAFGLIPAVLFGVFDCEDCVPGWLAALSIGAGAGVGLGIDAAFGPKTVFRGSAQPPRVSLAPIVGRDRRGVAASFRF